MNILDVLRFGPEEQKKKAGISRQEKKEDYRQEPENWNVKDKTEKSSKELEGMVERIVKIASTGIL